jgi:hypothetical protein
MRNIQLLTLDSAKLVVLALLGSLCTLCSLACLPSLGLGIALLSEQTAAWFRTLQWNPVPVASLLKQIGYAPHADGRGSNQELISYYAWRAAPH